MSRNFDFNFEFDKGMIGGLIMLVIFPPVGILMLVNRFRKFGRGKNKYRQIRNMGITTIAASLFYAFFELPAFAKSSKVFAVECLPGQFDQRAASASEWR